MQENNSIPAVGTEIPIEPKALVMSRDSRTQVCRIKYQVDSSRWAMVPARTDRRGILVNHGLLVFLNANASAQSTHIRITSIQKTGKGVYADPVRI
jgi:hypothetical protein